MNLKTAHQLMRQNKFSEAKSLLSELSKTYPNFSLYKQKLKECDEKLRPNQAENFSYSTTSYTPFKCKPITVDQDLSRFKNRPKNLPQNLKLPPLIGLGNNYSHLYELLDSEPEKSNAKASVVILTYNRSAPLERTLAGLTLQSYPKHLFEVIIADDGSHTDTLEIIRKFEDQLDIRYVWQTDKGFNAASSRNNGVSIARNDFIILLDVDMYPDPDLLRNYIKWWEIIDQVVLIGPRKYIDINDKTAKELMQLKAKPSTFKEIFTNNKVAGRTDGEKSVDWRLEIFANTHNLQTETRPYRVFASGNVAFSKQRFLDVGQFNERFNSWGYEDTELGFRFYNEGAYIIPEMTAWAYHQEPENGENEVDRSAGKQKSGEIFGDLCPHYRKLTSKTENFTTPTVSIYIPAYNAEATICDAVESALKQSFKDLEVCICDDGSTDSTLEVLERYYKNNPRVRYTSQKNGGIGAASNTAVSMCRGMFVGQLDSDDYLATDVVELCVKEFLNKPEIGLVYTSYENEYSDGTIKAGYNYPVFTREKMITACITHHFRMFRKLYWHRSEGFNERIKNAVDYDMYLKLAELCEVRHLNVVGYRRRLHGDNTSIVNFKEQMKNTSVVVSNSLKRLNLPYSSSLLEDDKSALSFEKSI